MAWGERRSGAGSGAREACRLPQDKKLILFSAFRTTSPIKGLNYFAEACKLYDRRHPEMREQIAIVAVGRDAEQLQGMFTYPVYPMGYVSDEHRMADIYNACDAFHQTASSDDGEGAFLAMQKALRMAGLQPQDIAYVNAHGTGTPNNDLSESQALKRLFGEQMPQVSSTKGMTGHTTSASGSVETTICLLALQHQIVPANYGWSKPMADGIVPATDTTPLRPLCHVMCNSFGFGGNDSSIIISKV